MEWYQALVLAIIQGLTEFLPVSSSGHLVLPQALLGWPDQGLAFDVAVHVGSLFAVVAYFRQTLWQMIQAWTVSISKPASLNDEGRELSRLTWLVFAATIPAGVVGVIFGDFIEDNLRSAGVLATTTIIYGVLLGVADKTAKGDRKLVEVTLGLALVIGFAQALALVPGTSRSGITITAALFLGLNRVDAARFSFLLSVPLIVAAGSLKGLELLQLGEAVDWAMITLGVFASGLTAYACIHVFITMVDRIGMMPFVIYRLLLGALLIALML